MKLWTRAILSLLLVSAWLGMAPIRSSADDPIPGNLVNNFSFEQGFYPYNPYEPGEVANGWSPFIVSGRPTFRDTAAMSPDFVEKIHGTDSQAIWSWGNPFVAGIYQRIENLTPNRTYTAWFASSGGYLFGNPPGLERTVGIDPYGGTDPSASTVVWGSKYDRGPWATRELETAPTVTAKAQASAVTLFIKVTSTAVYPQAYQAFVDAVALVEMAQPDQMTLATHQATFLATPLGELFPGVLPMTVGGAGLFSWTATLSSTGWLKASKAAGSVGEVVQLTVDPLPAQVGLYPGEIRVLASDGTVDGDQTVAVSLVVTTTLYHVSLPLLWQVRSAAWQ